MPSEAKTCLTTTDPSDVSNSAKSVTPSSSGSVEKALKSGCKTDGSSKSQKSDAPSANNKSPVKVVKKLVPKSSKASTSKATAVPTKVVQIVVKKEQSGSNMGTDAAPEVKKEEQDSSENMSELEKKIIRQIEYYFGDYNLNKDKFLKQQITLDDGWVPLDTLVTFNRLKTLSKDFNVIYEALKKSSSGLLEVNPESNKIRRSADKPLPDLATTQEEMLNRSVYVKGFKKTTTLDELLEFFKEHKVENINMHRLKPRQKGFKGSCFVTFETLEDVEKFLGLKGIKYQGTELLREAKKVYMKRKDELYQNLRKEKDNERQQRAEAMKKDGEALETKTVPGCLTGLSSEITREDLKAPLGKYGKVVYVDYSKGKPEGIVRFETGVAKDALEGLSVEEKDVEKSEFKGVKATVTLVEGDDAFICPHCLKKYSNSLSLKNHQKTPSCFVSCLWEYSGPYQQPKNPKKKKTETRTQWCMRNLHAILKTEAPPDEELLKRINRKLGLNKKNF